MMLTQLRRYYMDGYRIYRKSNPDKCYNITNLYTDEFTLNEILADDWTFKLRTDQKLFNFTEAIQFLTQGQIVFRLEWMEILNKFIKVSNKRTGNVIQCTLSSGKIVPISQYCINTHDVLANDWVVIKQCDIKDYIYDRRNRIV